MSGRAEGLLERATLFRFLSLLFQPPREGRSEELSALAAGLPGSLRLEGEKLARLFTGGAEDDYHRLFGGAGACRDCESDFERPSLGTKEVAADAAGFYRAFRFQGVREVPAPPDNVATELSFLGYLSLKAAYARGEGMGEEEAMCLDAGGKFVREHLGRWLDPFLDRVVEATKGEGFFGEAARFARGAIKNGLTKDRPPA